MADELLLGGPDLRVRVTGLRTALRQLERAGVEAEDIRGTMVRIGELVARAAIPRAPRRSGALAGTIRGGRGKTKAVIRAGGARVPYAGVRHYGWPARRIAPAPFLTAALADSRTAVFTELDNELGAMLERLELK